MARAPNWFKYYREKHNIPDLGCNEDNELLLVSRETLRLAMHGLRFSIAHSAELGEPLHVPSQLGLEEINAALMERHESATIATAHIIPQRKEPLNGQHKLRGAANVRPIHEVKRVRKDHCWSRWFR